MENKVVARFRDGRVVKGTTTNFSPAKSLFHLQTAQHNVIEVKFEELKAVFFVRQLDGNPTYHEVKGFSEARMYGQKIACRLVDGEVLTGFTQGYDPKRVGFFLIPSDPKSNNERVFVLNAAVLQVNVLK